MLNTPTNYRQTPSTGDDSYLSLFFIWFSLERGTDGWMDATESQKFQRIFFQFPVVVCNNGTHDGNVLYLVITHTVWQWKKTNKSNHVISLALRSIKKRVMTCRIATFSKVHWPTLLLFVPRLSEVEEGGYYITLRPVLPSVWLK